MQFSAPGSTYSAKDRTLVLAGETMKAATAVLTPAIQKLGGSRQKPGKVVLGTVKGAIHEIGKTPVGTMLSASGFEVVDLGVNGTSCGRG